MRRVAFLTLHDPAGFVIDDELAVLPLARRGIKVETIPWDRADVDWRQYALVVIRSTWDYPHDAEAFLRVLETIERLGVRLENGSEIVRWNMRKTYLRDLAARGIEIVPTFWREGLRRGELVPLFEELRSNEARDQARHGRQRPGRLATRRASAPASSRPRSRRTSPAGRS